MPKPKPNFENPVELVRSLVTDNLAAFNGLMNIEGLPEVGRTVMQDAINKLNERLKGLPPIEQHAGAEVARNMLQEMHWVVTHCNETFASMQEQYGITLASLNSLAARNATEVETEIASRITTGVLFEKAAVDGLVAAARTTALNEYKAELDKQKARKATLATNGLPGDVEVALIGTDEEFQARVEEGKIRLATLKTRNIPADNPILRAVFSAPEEFAARLEILDSVLGTKKPGKPAGSQNIDPLAAPSKPAGTKVVACI